MQGATKRYLILKGHRRLFFLALTAILSTYTYYPEARHGGGGGGIEVCLSILSLLTWMR